MRFQKVAHGMKNPHLLVIIDHHLPLTVVVVAVARAVLLSSKSLNYAHWWLHYLFVTERTGPATTVKVMWIMMMN